MVATDNPLDGSNPKSSRALKGTVSWPRTSNCVAQWRPVLEAGPWHVLSTSLTRTLNGGPRRQPLDPQPPPLETRCHYGHCCYPLTVDCAGLISRSWQSDLVCYFPRSSLWALLYSGSLGKCVCVCVCVCVPGYAQLFATPWTVAHQAPLFMEFSKQEYWNGLPFPPLGDLPHPGIKPTSLASPALAGGFFTTSAT